MDDVLAIDYMVSIEYLAARYDVSERAFFAFLKLLFFKAPRLIWFSFLGLRDINPRVFHGIDEQHGKIFCPWFKFF